MILHSARCFLTLRQIVKFTNEEIPLTRIGVIGFRDGQGVRTKNINVGHAFGTSNSSHCYLTTSLRPREWKNFLSRV